MPASQWRYREVTCPSRSCTLLRSTGSSVIPTVHVLCGGPRAAMYFLASAIICNLSIDGSRAGRNIRPALRQDRVAWPPGSAACANRGPIRAGCGGPAGAALRPIVGRLGRDGAARGGKQPPPAPRPRRAGRLARTGRSARRACGKNGQKRRDPCRRKAAGRSPRRPRPCVQSAISGAARRGGHAQGASAPSAAAPSRRASTLGAAFP